ncbi:Glutamyl-tRNA(Gln) synthetase [hydrothermal vent metagenome]|uniref:Glutamyl-tRNA(Gln) synthetase n=1 Tax=hydrothermal vent metagenome TaxID=652676 RepID=A0A3B0TVR9_9ZZZZ
MSQHKKIVRFAPSPTGLIHLGNARPALYNFLFAKANDATFVLRFDDTDKERSRAEFAEAIEQDLAWLGIVPDLVVRQSDRVALYDAARDRLIAEGRLYPCYETGDELDRRRARARAMGRPPIYDRAALELDNEQRHELEQEGRKPHWRFKLKGEPVHFADLVRGQQTVNNASMSDPVLIRHDGSYLYTLPSVVDDIDLGVTHIIRGEDHISNSGVQIEIFEALGGTPPVFAHHNLLTGTDGKGFSKRDGSLSIKSLREQGFEPMAVAIMAVLTGTSLPLAPCDSLDELAEKLDFGAISHGAARFDPAELEALNARILHQSDFSSLKERLQEFGVTEEKIWLALRNNISRLPQIADWLPLINGPVTPSIDENDRQFIEQAKQLLPPEPWDENVWKDWTSAIKKETGRKGKPLFMPLRQALTGRSDGPELKTLLPLMGRKECLDRLSG